MKEGYKSTHINILHVLFKILFIQSFATKKISRVNQRVFQRREVTNKRELKKCVFSCFIKKHNLFLYLIIVWNKVVIKDL